MRPRLSLHLLNLSFCRGQVQIRCALKAAGWLPIFCFALFSPSNPLAGDWKEVQGDGFLLRFRASDRALAEVLLADLVEGRAEIARKLGGVPEASMAVTLASSQGDFRDLTGGRIPHWGVGVAFPETGVVVLKKLPGRGGELLKVGRHEMAHILLHHALPGRVPVWFDEGVAMWAAQEWRLRQSVEVFYAVLSGGLVPLKEIDDVLSFASPRAHLAYTQSLLAVTFLIHAGGPDAVGEMVSELASGSPFDVALYRVTGLTPHQFERRWARYVRGRFSLTAMLVEPKALWVYLALLFLAAYVAVRVRNRSVLKRWENEDPADALPLKMRLQVHRRKERP